MWCTIPAPTFLRRLVALSAGLLVTMLLPMLVGALPVALASHVPDCWGLHPTNTPPGPGGGTILGTSGDDVLAGGPGNDTITGFDGSDRLCGNEGNDTILGNTGYRDRIDGGPGDDHLGGGEFVPAQFGEPSCGPASGGAGEPFPNANFPAYNRILGGPGADRILGGGATDLVFSGDGDDCLMGIDGDDH